MSIALYLFITIKLLLFDRIISLSTNNSKNLDNSKLYSINNNITIKRKLEEEYKPIIIYFDTYHMEKFTLSESEYLEIKNLVLQALEITKRTIERLFMVKKDEIKVNPGEYKQKVLDLGKQPNFDNEDADLVILVDYSFISPKCSESIEIIKGSKTERPTIGYFRINHSIISKVTEDYSKLEFYKYYMLHQTTHILGFARSILDGHFYPYTTNRFGKTIQKQVIRTDNLMEFGRKYFNCDTNSFQGIEIEELLPDSECNEFIHWDARVLSGDYMTAHINVQDQVISEFTLILLEDTGFYKVNKFTGGLMRFGKNVGCNFFTQDCNEQLPEELIGGKNTTRKPLFENEFCSGQLKTTCSPDRQSRGVCDYYLAGLTVTTIKNSSYVRSDWTDNYGDQYVDFCPISLNQKEASSDEISYIGNCKLGNRYFGQPSFFFWNQAYTQIDYTTFSDTYGESFSEISFCAFSSVIHKNDQNKFYNGFIRPTCYEMYCSDSSLTIRINELYIVCPRSGGYISIEGKSSNYIGHLLCSDYNLICSQSVPCNNMFDCVEKNSTMKLNPDYDYEPKDVSTQIILPDTSKTYPRAYEIAENGICPRNCSQCNINHHCFECNVSSPYYLAEKPGDSIPNNCSEIPPIKNFYYNTTNITFYQCLPNCKVCTGPDYCNQCGPEYKLNNPHTRCLPRIIGCGNYNKSSNYTDEDTNGGGEGYKLCEKCNETGGYYCFNEDKQFCDTVKDDINTYFNNSFGCLEKCEKRFPNCYNCTPEKCHSCKEGFYPNNSNVCLKKVEHCELDNKASDHSECNKCEDNTVK